VGEFKNWERIIDEWVADLSVISGITVAREELNEAGQPIPRVRIQFSQEIVPKVIAELQSLDPIIEVVHNSKDIIWLSADGLQENEKDIVITQIRKALSKFKF
jgi:hypothetical protein